MRLPRRLNLNHPPRVVLWGLGLLVLLAFLSSP